ncbi:MAG TPA: hypothetical protein VMR34_01185 [Candidatus Saccharimonadales bacterium]|nr:hypothetical protein [Candidatus Saccharimonadales bacterium]
MSRKEFMTTLGVGFVSLIGITALLSALEATHSLGNPNASQIPGFGGGRYGGHHAKDVYDSNKAY